MLGRPKRVGVATGLYRMIGDEELTRLIASESPDRGPTLGMVEIDYAGDTFEIDVAKAMKTPLRVSDTNAFVEVLRYIPHANVEPGGEVVSVSPDPINPAVEVVVSIGEKTHTQIAFARFPGFKSQHGGGDDADFDVRYVLPKTLEPRAPIEVFRNGDGKLFVRFAWQGTSPVTQRVVVGEPIETPWPGKTLVVQDVLEHARVEKQLAEVSPVRDNRIPAIRIVASGPSGEKSTWVRRRMPSEMKIDGTPFRLSFGDRIVPLAFKVTLDRFRVRYYPGTRRPRSFESQITFTDPSSGLSQARIISMNHPTSFGGYTLYQSSYAMNPGEPAISYLSIARDPGVPFVFAGYIGTMIGMLLVLITRAKQQKQRSANRLAVAGDHQAQHSATRSPRSQRESVLVSPGQGVYQKGVTGNGNGEINLLGRAAPCQR